MPQPARPRARSRKTPASGDRSAVIRPAAGEEPDRCGPVSPLFSPAKGVVARPCVVDDCAIIRLPIKKFQWRQGRQPRLVADLASKGVCACSAEPHGRAAMRVPRPPPSPAPGSTPRRPETRPRIRRSGVARAIGPPPWQVSRRSRSPLSSLEAGLPQSRGLAARGRLPDSESSSRRCP